MAIEIVTQSSTAIDIKPNAVALGGAVTGNTALRIYGDIVANNITTALDKLTSAETLINTLVDELTRGTYHSATHTVSTTAKDWFYTGLSLAYEEAPYGSLVSIRSNWATRGISGIAVGTSSSDSASSRKFAYCPSSNQIICFGPIFYNVIDSGTIYVHARSNSTGASSDNANTFYIRRLLKTHA
jgi:hypothetical protein